MSGDIGNTPRLVIGNLKKTSFQHVSTKYRSCSLFCDVFRVFCSSNFDPPGTGAVAGHEEDQPKSKGHALGRRVVLISS